MSEFKFPTEEIELPSKGLVYSKDNPLSSGKVEMKYMTAREEDILSNQSYIQKGTVLDKLLDSLIIDKNINIMSTKSNRKISSSIAAISLNKTQNILQDVLKPVSGNIEHAKNLIKQILVTAAQKNLINKYWLTDEDLSTKLQNLWKAFKEDIDLKALTNHVLTLVSYVDALRLMEEILDECTNTSSQ